MPLKPIDQACFEVARRVVCGDRGEVMVYQDGSFLINTAHFKLRPSRDPTDALIVSTAKVIKLHLRGVDLGKLREDLLSRRVGEDLTDFANLVHKHLVSFTVEDWDAIRARADFYAEYNAETALPKTDTSGDT
jgi:hypothetical protein